MNNTTVKKNDGIINNCKIQENIIPMDNTTAPAVTKSKKVQATSLSLKTDVRQRLIDLSDACNMSKTEFTSRLIMDSDSRIVSFPEGKEILTDIARCYQILSDITDNMDDNSILHDKLDSVIKALNNAAFSMSCLCNKMDALLPGEEVTDDDN